MKLPDQFQENMKRLLGEAYAPFAASFDAGRRNALRVNRLKLTSEQFEAVSPFALEQVPWAQGGYYVDYRDYPGQHPFYRAGLYYLQEPSAMAPAQILPAAPGDRVLDLCAAPGGKATELGVRIGGEGLLVANEISSSRVRALKRNLELFGIRNAIVTNEPPHRLQERFLSFFDQVLVDAPCSGEGMFRKNPEAVATWSLEKVKECAAVQREILLLAADMLRPGGYLVYSTCTFEPEENELAIWHLLLRRPDMELVRIDCTQGRESFARAYSAGELAEKGYDLQGYPLPSGSPDLTCAVRIWPHRSGGEGHFIALLHRKETGIADCGLAQADRGKKKEKRKGRKEQGKRAAAVSGSGSLSKTELQIFSQFMAEYAPDLSIDLRRCEIRDAHVYLMPEDKLNLSGLQFLRAGLFLGTFKKNRFEPSQELAMALPPAPDKERTPQTVPDGADAYEDDGRYLRFPADSDLLNAFLRGETLRLKEGGRNGWRLVCASRWPVGWGKLAAGVLKNHIPAGWRSGT